jgi:hypothetical protein
MKPFTVALALEKGKVTADTIINCAPGRMTIGSATIPTPTPTGPDGGPGDPEVLQHRRRQDGPAPFRRRTMWKMF